MRPIALTLLSAIPVLVPLLAWGQGQPPAVLSRHLCGPEGVVATGTFLRQVLVGHEGSDRPVTLSREFILTCHDSEIILRLRSDDVMLEIWDIVSVADDSLGGDATKTMIFTRTGGTHMSVTLTFARRMASPNPIRSQYDAILLHNYQFGARLLFGRVSYVSPSYAHLLPVGTPERR